MQIEDLIEAFNLTISQYRKLHNIDNKSHIVLQKNIEQNNTFKAYKTYIRTLWYVNGRNKYTVLKCAIIAKVLQEHEESMIKQINRRLLLEIFNLMLSEEFDNILKGTYNGTATEKIYRN